jgi:hypothetical protein
MKGSFGTGLNIRGLHTYVHMYMYMYSTWVYTFPSNHRSRCALTLLDAFRRGLEDLKRRICARFDTELERASQRAGKSLSPTSGITTSAGADAPEPQPRLASEQQHPNHFADVMNTVPRTPRKAKPNKSRPTRSNSFRLPARQFPLASLLHPLRSSASQWLAIPIILIVGFLVRWAVGLGPYSGRNCEENANPEL